MLTNAGALLADESPMRFSRIFCTRWYGLSKASGVMEALDDKEISGSLITLLQGGEEFVRNNTKKRWKKTGNGRVEMPEMASQSGGTEAVDTTGVPVAHGGPVHRTDKGLQAGKAGERLLRCGRSLNVAEQRALYKVWIITVAGLENNDLHIQKDRIPVLAAEQQEEDEGQGAAETFPVL